MRGLGILVLFFLASLHFASAQNCAPITVEGIYHFKASGSSVISHIIQTDSTVTNSNGEAVLFLNRIVENCDTRSFNINTPIEVLPTCDIYPAAMFYFNAGQFLQKDVTIQAGGGYFSTETILS